MKGITILLLTFSQFHLLLCTSFRLQTEDCPLCVAGEACQMSCASIKKIDPGSAYCMNACIGAHPDDDFGPEWFAAVDKQIEEDNKTQKFFDDFMKNPDGE